MYSCPMTAIFDFIARTPGNISRGLEWVIDHPADTAGIAIVVVAIAVSLTINVRAWRR